MSQLAGTFVSSAASALGGLFGAKSQNDSIDKQIEAQRLENKLNRQYNLQLAKQQNQWNIEQWNRENQYNDPSAQMARFKAAGLNPNLIYGQSNTSGQLSGSLSAGAPSSPADVSALGNKRNGLSSVFDAIKQNPFLSEQLRGMKLDNDKKQQDLYESEVTFDVRFEGLKLSNAKLKADAENVKQSTQNLIASADEIRARTANIDEDTVDKVLNRGLRVMETNGKLRMMAAQTHRTEAECKEILLLLNKKLLLADKQLEMSDAQMKLWDAQGILIGKQGDEIDFRIGEDDQEALDTQRTLNTWDYIIGYGRDLLSLAGTFFGGNYEGTYTDVVEESSDGKWKSKQITTTKKRKKKR